MHFAFRVYVATARPRLRQGSKKGLELGQEVKRSQLALGR